MSDQVQAASGSSQVVVYSTGFCPYCFLAKRLLQRHGVSFEERRMRRGERMDLSSLGGGLTFPQIMIGDRVVNGFVELRQLEREDELGRLLTG